MTSFLDRFEYTTPEDPFQNYCLWDYTPVAPSHDKFRALNLLLQSYELAGLDPRAYDFVEALREGIGPFRTVFGVKWIEGRVGWEFYFYDYARLEREVSMSRVVNALRPFAKCRVPVNEKIPYFMFSLDVDDELVRGARELDCLHMYVGNAGSTVSSGIAYALRPDSSCLENFYFFFDASTQLEDVARKIFTSAWVEPGRIDVDGVLWPELRECQTICVANKQQNDCVYYAGVNVVQLLWFLRRLGYPREIIDFVEENQGDLDHLLYDVGVDYRLEGDQLVPLKSGYYGVF